jgi:hypothetical protein
VRSHESDILFAYLHVVLSSKGYKSLYSTLSKDDVLQNCNSMHVVIAANHEAEKLISHINIK